MQKKSAEKVQAPTVARVPKPAPSPKGCATKLDVLARKRYVSEQMARGAGSQVAAERLAKHCGITVEQAQTYVTAVRKDWAEIETAERPTRRAWCLRVLEQVIEDAMLAGDLKAANGAVREVARITGLDVREIQLTGGVGALQEQIMAALTAARPGDALEAPARAEDGHDTDA